MLLPHSDAGTDDAVAAARKINPPAAEFWLPSRIVPDWCYFSVIRDRARTTVNAQGDELELGLGHLDGVTRTVAVNPGFDVDLQRSIADALDLGIYAENVAHLDRANKAHAVECDRHGATLRTLGRADAAGDIHLRQHPATENVTGRILIGGHCEDARGEFAARFIGHVEAPYVSDFEW